MRIEDASLQKGDHQVAGQEQELKAILKPRKKRTPSLATIRRTLCNISVDKLEEMLTRYQRMLEQKSGDAGVIVTRQDEVLRGQPLHSKTGDSAHGKLVYLKAAFVLLSPQVPCEQEFWDHASTTVNRRGHGRTDIYLIESPIESTTALNRYLDFSDIAQVVRRTRPDTQKFALAKPKGIVYAVSYRI
jgi:hypothetical protein